MCTRDAVAPGSNRQKSNDERQKWDNYYASLPPLKIDAAMQGLGEDLARRIHELLPSGGRVLEAGCGGGWQSLVLAQTGGLQVALMDFSTEALHCARRAFAEHNLSAEFTCQDVFVPGQPEYDLVFNAGVLEHYTFDEQVAFLRGMASRSTKYVLALVPNRMCYWYWLWRVQCSGRGGWPYGQEMPMADLSAAFEAAGLQFLGQWFGGGNWTELFIKDLAGIDDRLRSEILAIHGSPVIPDGQRAYLVAALGCKGEAASVPACWTRPEAREEHVVSQAIASTADALALSVAAEHRCRQLENERSQATNELREREAECGALRNEIQSQTAQLADREQQLGAAWAALGGCQSQLNAITGSRAWALVERWRALRQRLAPRGSRREAAARHSWRTARRLAAPSALVKAAARPVFRQLPPALQYRIRGTLAAVRRRRPYPRPVAGTLEEIHEVPGLVSVVLPVYNQAALLRGAVESVLAQNYRNFELIIVNDGSTDGAERVLAEYVGHPQVRILTQDNQKLPKALSNGFEFARGEFFTWTSADNLMHPDQLRRQVEFLRTHTDVGMVFADYTVIDDKGRPLADPTFRPHNRRTPHDPQIHLPHDTRRFGLDGDNYLGPCFLYRGWIGRLLGDYDPSLGIEDFDYWLRLSLVAPIAHLDSDEPLYQYRVHNNSISARADELKIPERTHQLVDYHRSREEFYARPWTIYADAATLAWLNKSDAVVEKGDSPHLCAAPSGPFRQMGTVPFFHGPHRVVPWSGEPLVGDGDEKVMLLVEAESLPAAVQSRGSAGKRGQSPFAGTARRVLRTNGDCPLFPAAVCLVAWFPADADSANRYRAESRGAADLCFAADEATAARLAMLTPHVFQAAPGPKLVTLATTWANGKLFHEATRTNAERTRSLPRVFRPEKRAVRVLLQADDFTQGGTEQVVLDLARSLRNDDFDVSLLILGKQGSDVEKIRQAGVPVLTLPGGGRESHYRRLLKDRRINVVNAHYSLFGSWIAAESGIPFVQNIHNSYVYLPPEGAADYRAHDPFTSAYACVSQMAAHYSDVKLGLPVSKMVLMPNGVDLARLDAVGRDARPSLRRELGLADDDFVFLNVACFQPLKCQATLVNAFAEVIRRQPEAKLVLVGQQMYMHPAYYAEVERTIARHGLEHAVLLTGLRHDVPRFYAAADAFVLPSLVEGWSLALGEAVAAGLPVVATGVGSAPDLLPRIGGRLIRPPFGDITNLDCLNLGQYCTNEDPQFVADLAAAMEDVCRERSRPLIPDAFRRSLDCREAYKPYGELYLWLMRGGHPQRGKALGRRPPGIVPDLAFGRLDSRLKGVSMLTLTKRLLRAGQRRLCRSSEPPEKIEIPAPPPAVEPHNCLGDDLDPETLALMKRAKENGPQSAGLSGDDEAQIFELDFWRGVAFYGYEQVAPQDFPAFQQKWMLSSFDKTGWSPEELRGCDLVEIGCGPLGMIEFLPGRRKVACDPLNDHYARLFRRARSGTVRYCSRLDDLLPSEAGAFDLAICFNVLDHTRDSRKLFDSFMSLVKPGGRFLLQVNTVREGADRLPEHARMHPSPLTVETVRSWLAEYSSRCQDVLSAEPTPFGEYFFMSFGYKDRRIA